jgi:hypothetical protein
MQARWVNVLADGSGLFNLVDADHPLSIFMGGSPAGEACLTITLDERPPQISALANVVIEHRLRADGSWLLLFQLTSMSAFTQFVSMCHELVTRSMSASGQLASLRDFLAGLDKWRLLFRPAPNKLLSEGRLRGLVAELNCFANLLLPARSAEDVVTGWVGPLASPHDFKLADSLAIEVKSVHKDSRDIHIASLEQLEHQDVRLALLTTVVERSISDAVGAITVGELVYKISETLTDRPDLEDEFQLRLREVGMDSADLSYDEIFFTIGKTTYYAVDKSFPRLSRATTAPQICRVEYDLDIRDLDEFEMDGTSFASALRDRSGAIEWS